MCNMIRTVVFLLFANCCVNVSRSEDNLLDAFDSLMVMLPLHCTCNLTDNKLLLAKIDEIRIRLSNEDSRRSDNSICDQTAMQWSHSGSIAGKHCVQIIEIADPHTWSDNYLCFDRDYGVRWSSNQPIAGMKCTKIVEVADPNTWDDNYLCVPTTSTFAFHFSSAGAAANFVLYSDE